LPMQCSKWRTLAHLLDLVVRLENSVGESTNKILDL
jgi:hypothetical protein